MMLPPSPPISICLRPANHRSFSLSWAGQDELMQMISIPLVSRATASPHLGHELGSFDFATRCRLKYSGQRLFTHRQATTFGGYGSCSTADAQDGHFFGGKTGEALADRFSVSTATTCGMTSPARSITTLSFRCK